MKRAPPCGTGGASHAGTHRPRLAHHGLRCSGTDSRGKSQTSHCGADSRAGLNHAAYGLRSEDRNQMAQTITACIRLETTMQATGEKTHGNHTGSTEDGWS